MSEYTELFSETHAPLAVFGATAATTEQNSGWINIAKYGRVVVLVYGLQITTTLDADLEIATDAAATGLFTLKSLTQLDDTDDVIAAIELRSDEMGKPVGASSANYDWINVEITPSGEAAFTCVVFGFVPRYAPIDQTLWTEVVE